VVQRRTLWRKLKLPSNDAAQGCSIPQPQDFCPCGCLFTSILAGDLDLFRGPGYTHRTLARHGEQLRLHALTRSLSWSCFERLARTRHRDSRHSRSSLEPGVGSWSSLLPTFPDSLGLGRDHVEVV
jgi:hypothetical protein